MLRALTVGSLVVFAASCDCSGKSPLFVDGGLVCTSPLVACATGCSDLTTDDNNCGSCDAPCGAGQGCAGSRCYSTTCNGEPCAADQVCITGFCVDKDCFGVVCPMDQVCAAGMCLPTTCQAQTCAVGFVCLNNACVEGDCVGILCPSGSVCEKGACVFNTCADLMKDGSETDVDCGGGSCPACIPGRACGSASDCTSQSCKQGYCQAPTCNDGLRNGGEGDVDCGGLCPPCPDGKTCTSGSQCSSAVCTMGVCAVASCTDTVQNGPETDTDCGGGCLGCADGKNCVTGGDCASARCASGKCESSQCLDGMTDGTETDTDCGGACIGCMPGQACDGGSDCLSLSCNAMKKCDAPSCTDAVQNGTETDINCGGSCPACPVGDKCRVGADCLSLSCSATTHRCLGASCTDHIKNENETDIDCGGPTTCPRCGFSRACTQPSDCASADCSGGACTLAPIFGPTWDQYPESAPYDVIVRDMDNDGNLDLVVTNDGNYALTLYWGTGDGTFTQAPGPVVSGQLDMQSISGPRGISVGDFNGDGKLDLLIGREYSNQWCVLTVLLGAGNRTFATPQDVAVTTQMLGCGEQTKTFLYNSDTLSDVLITSDLSEQGSGYLYTGVMSGSPAAPLKIDGIGSYAAVADLNGDGIPDIVSHQGALSNVYVHLGQDDGGFATPTVNPLAPGHGQVAIGKIDGDDTLDLAVACDSSGTISVALGRGDGTFLAAVGVGAGGGHSVSLADFDGDGNTDMISSGGVVHFNRGKGNGQFYPLENYGPGSTGGSWLVAIGDFNKDGKVDAVMLYRVSGGSSIVVLKNISP